MEQYGFFSNSGAGQTTKKTEQRRRNCTTTATAKREYPPLLTTSLVRPGTAGLQKVMKRFNFVKRYVNEGRRVVVEAEEIGNENQYYLKVSRANGRLVVSLVPMNELNSCDDDDDGDEMFESDDICVDSDEVVDSEEDGGKGGQVKATDKDHPPLKMAFPFFESAFVPESNRSVI